MQISKSTRHALNMHLKMLSEWDVILELYCTRVMDIAIS